MSYQAADCSLRGKISILIAWSMLILRRAREIQAQEGVPSALNVWGPPTSGHSTPLRENIPESPTDGFPEYQPLPSAENLPQTRRARAGTVPSRFSPGGINLGQIPNLSSASQRVTPVSTPTYQSPSPNGLKDIGEGNAAGNSALLSRLRAGSMPQRANLGNAFGPSVFSSNWGQGRERTSTLASIASIGSNGPSSPAQSHYSREGTAETEMQIKTLDYLGLADTPQPPRALLANPLSNQYLANVIEQTKQANRFRSYSVNAKEKYAEDEDDYEDGTMSPYESAQQQLAYQLAQTNLAIQQHNLAVQAYANQASSNRPRARTAGVLDSPNSRLMQGYYPRASRLDNSMSAADLGILESTEHDGLPEAIKAINLGHSHPSPDYLQIDDTGAQNATKSLWLGNIPPSTTVTTLTEMFKTHGPVQSARVLTHKNCGFVNFEKESHAISARNMMNGKEIFPGAGPVRINFAKPTSATGSPSHDGLYPSPSPDPLGKAAAQNGLSAASGISRPGTAPVVLPVLQDLAAEISQIVVEFGANEDDQAKVERLMSSAIAFSGYESEVPAVDEPSQSRLHDAPKLRDIRKRIDNGMCSAAEIEQIALEMLPEIAELSSDYLGNTVVQKLFEFCSDDVKSAMLAEIAPHMAGIGVHKNGTWAAQKIIDVTKQPQQMEQIVNNLRPYTVPLFLDQFGNYVLQGCLRFGSPYNDFIFEVMLTKLWDIAQGRFGARAMRACLESHHSTREQQRMLAAAIALHSVQLATNANGALLLTWFLDTCTFPQRRTVLAPRLVPHLVHLCTHKVAYLTVLKVINQRTEPEARDIILKALFFSPENQTLENILSDHNCGATLIFKVLTTPFFDEAIRAQVVDNIKNVLMRIKAQPGQGYKRLMDEVGLSTRNGSAGVRGDHGHHGHDRQHRGAGHVAQNSQHMNNYYNPMHQQAMDMSMQRTDSADSIMSPYQGYSMQALFPAGVQASPVAYGQVPYQGNMAGRQGQGQMNNYGQYGQAGYNSSSPAIDHYRNQGLMNGSGGQAPQMGGSPMMGGFAPPGYTSMPGGYGYGQVPMQSMGYMQQEQGSGRQRGRVSIFHVKEAL